MIFSRHLYILVHWLLITLCAEPVGSSVRTELCPKHLSIPKGPKMTVRLEALPKHSAGKRQAWKDLEHHYQEIRRM